MKVIILSDNKPGHYKQSLGIVQKMPECQMEWFEIQFRAKWRDNLLRVFMCIFGGLPLPTSFVHMLLRLSLTTAAYNAILKIQDVDVVLSTGSSVAAVNLLLGKVLRAKTITCRRPSPIGLRYFDLAILPMFSWENAKGGENIYKTIGVPNPISPEGLNTERVRLLQHLKLPDCPRVGLLIGGTDKYETITIEDAERLCEIGRAIAKKINIQILVTTSRRTPPDVAMHLKSQLAHADWCAFFIEPDTPLELDDPYQAILALSDLLIVTADSFSMVCEAASSGRKVIVLSLSQKKRRQPKRYQVYAYMEHHLIVKRSTLDELSQQVEVALALSNTTNTPLQDTKKAAEAIGKLIKKNK